MGMPPPGPWLPHRTGRWAGSGEPEAAERPLTLAGGSCHYFHDNKQIAVLASFVFLELNGHTVETSNDDAVSTVLDLITRNIDFAEPGVRIERWITSSAAG